MSDTVKTKVIDVQTGQSVKNVDNLTSSFKPLSKQIKELRNQLSQLEQGTVEYNRVAKQMADLQQKNIEITEAAKYSNRDFGQTMSNLTNVSLGLVGGINAISASMALLGGDSEKMQKALVPIQLIMAAIQGFSSLDTAIKSLNGLKNAFSGLADMEDIAKIETVKAEIDSIPDVKTINIEVNSGQATAELAAVSAAANGVADAESNIANGGKAVGGAMKTMGKTGKGISGILGGVAKGFKAAAVAVKGFIASNPILLAIAAAIGAVAAGLTFLNKKMEENGRVAKEEANILSDANSQLEEQTVRLNVLKRTAEDQNQSLMERKKAVEELNKVVPNYNAQIDETTGKLVANNQAMTEYIANLRQKILLESYEGKIKEYLQKQLELEEEINDLEATGWWRVQARVRKRREEIKMLEGDIERLYGKIDGLDIGRALDPNKVANKTASKVASSLKSIQDALKETRKVAENFWNTMYDARVLQRNVRGIESAFGNLRDTVYKTITNFKISPSVLTDQLKDFIEKGTKSINRGIFESGMFSVDDMFDTSVLKDLEDKANKYANNIERLANRLADGTGNLTEQQTKQYEQQKKYFENRLADVQREVEAYNRLVEAGEKYKEEQRKEREETITSQADLKKLNAELEINRKFREQTISGDFLASYNQSISLSEEEIKRLQEINEGFRQQIMLGEGIRGNADAIKEYERKILENETEISKLTNQIEIDKYNRNKEIAQHYYEELEAVVSEGQEKIEQRNSIWGLGSAAYNTELQKQQLLVDTIQSEIDTINKQHEQGILSEELYNARMLELKNHLNEETKKLDKERINSAVSAVQTYVNVFNSVTSTIGNLLQSQMDMYDENSEEYKKLQVAQGWINTLSGTLGAFMSGVNSGIPAPYNLILAAAMAATTFAAGAAQVGNIESDSHTNSMTSGASSAGTSTYETTAFQQQNEMLSNIGDQRVYVLENDISTAQNRVNVREENATY